MSDKEVIIGGKSITNRVFVFFILLISYYIVNILTSSDFSGMNNRFMAENNIYNQISAGAIIAYTFFFTFCKGKSVNWNVYKLSLIMIIYLVLNFLYEFFENDKFAISQVNSFFYIVFSLMIFAFSVKNMKSIDKQLLNKLLQISCYVMFFFVTYKIIIQKAILSSYGVVSGINAAGSVYMLVPLIFLCFKGKMKVIMYVYCLILCVLSAKRQALLGFSIVSIFLIKDFIRIYWKSFRVKGIAIVFIALFFASDSIVSLFDDMVARQERIAEMGGPMDSGRSDLRNAAFLGFLGSSLLNQIVGGGTGQGALYIKEKLDVFNYPHCGFVEVLCDYGIIYLFMFGLFLYKLFRYSDKLEDQQIKNVSKAAVVAIVYVNCVSHSGNMSVLYLMLALGYIYTFNQDFIYEETES